MPDHTAEQILTAVANGRSIATAAELAGYTDRTVYRYAATHPDYAQRLRESRHRERPVRHGTPTGYNQGCRDTCCRTAKTLAQADWRRRKAAS